MKKIDTVNEFKTLLNEQDLVMVYFSRLWCGVCHAMKPQVEKLMQGYPDISLVEVNLDDTPDLAAQNTIFSVPALVLFYQGKEFMRQAGYLKLDQVERILNRFNELA